jgi:hypothetical protein
MTRPSIAELQQSIAAPHGTPPRRLTDAEITAQQAGYHDFNAIESMAVELREHRRHASLVNAAPVLLEIAAAALAWQTSPQAKARQARAQLLAALGKVAP